MKLLIIIFTILAIFSCKDKTEKTNIILQFEKSIGSKEAIYLEKLVYNFDKYLENTYPDEDERFKKLLIDIKEQSINTYWKISSTEKQTIKILDQIQVENYKKDNYIVGNSKFMKALTIIQNKDV